MLRGECNAWWKRAAGRRRRGVSHAVLQIGDGAQGRARRRPRPLRGPRAAGAHQSGWDGRGRSGLRAGRPVRVGAERRPRSEPAPAVPEGDPRLLPESRVRLRRPGRVQRPRPERARQRECGDRGWGGIALRYSNPRLPPVRRRARGGEQGAVAGRPVARLQSPSPPRPGAGLAGDRGAVDRRDDGAVGRKNGEGEPHHPRRAGPMGAAQPPACRPGHRRRSPHRRDRTVAPRPAPGARRHPGQRHSTRYLDRADGEAQTCVRPSLRQRDRRELLAAHGRRLGGPAHERRRGAGARLRAARLHPVICGRRRRPRLAAAPGPDLRGSQGARVRRHRMAGPRTGRGPRGVRGAGTLQPPGLGGQGLGDRPGDHQRDGWVHRDRSPVRRDGGPHHHHARQRDGPPRRAIRPAVDLRAGRYGFRHGPGAALMAGSALSWELADGIAVLTLDMKGEAVNKISRALKADFLATFESLEREGAVRGVAFFSGKVERAQKAFRLGIVDELVHPAILRDVTIAAAQRMAGGWRPKRKRPGGFTGWLLDGNLLGRRLVFRGARKQVLKQTKGNYPAPLAALEAVEYGLAHGLAKGLKREAQLFGQLAVTDVSRKLVQIFFATSQLKKDFGVPNPPPPTEVRRLGVVGSGFMGSGIAGTAVVQAAVDVRMKDADLPRVAKGLATAREILDERLQRRRLTKYEHARLVALLSGADTYAGFGRADLVIEAVFEDLTVKRQVLREVEAVTPERAVFASNTSTIPIGRIAEAAQRPEQVIGMHFFSPVARMPLLEVIPSARTAPGVVTTAVAFGRRMGKTAIVVKDSPGFWVNRILTPYMNEAGHLLAEGTAIEELDDLMVQFGFPVGPITLLDEVGMDVAEKVAGVMHEAFGERFAPSPAFAELVKAGRLGRKAGKGFYTYARGKKGAVDAAVYQLMGTQPNGGPRPAEAIQRLVLAMLNEAARAVGEGIVARPRG